MGVFEEAKGKVKEKTGEALDNDRLEEEGRAQARRGEEERRATQARAEAKAHEGKAKLAQQRHERAQDS